ncbi:MAG TPA: hypothetical protein DC054_16820 [Blastocatellia bacterium]|nr:hypothetical protein [Blastocatellia bacterium]
MSESNDNLIGFIASTVETLRDEVTTMRQQMATREDLARLEGRFTEKLARLEGRFTEKLDVSTTSVRGDIEQVQLRLDSIEHGVSSRFEHVEGELSRLRSAVYLLGKDRPEVLRLLGQAGT